MGTACRSGRQRLTGSRRVRLSPVRRGSPPDGHRKGQTARVWPFANASAVESMAYNCPMARPWPFPPKTKLAREEVALGVSERS